MGSASVQPSTLLIGRLSNRYLVPDEHQAPEEVRSLCESALAAMLSESLAAVLGPALPADDSSLWFIRSLEVDFAVNMELNFSNLSDIWAKEIAAGLVCALQKGGDEILRFPDRTAYMAHFFLDLAEGSAWNKWHYTQLDGLRMLPISAALRTSICDSPEIGLCALRSLQDPSVVLRKINSEDAARILAAFEFNTIPDDESACFQAITDIWQTVLSVPVRDEELRALLLFVNIAHSNAALANKTLGAAALAVCRLARCLHEERGPRSHDIISALRNEDVSNFYRLAGLEQATVLAPLLRCPVECLDRLLQRVADGSATDPETRQKTRFTAFGGAFLLFPLLDRFPFHEATAGWPDLGNVSAASLARFLVLAKCFGRLRAAGCFHDPLMRDLLGIPPQITLEMVCNWLSHLSRNNSKTFLHAISGWHLETAAAEGQIFSLVSVAQRGAPVVLLLDHARGLWLFAGRFGKHEDELAAALSDLPSPERLLSNDSLVPIAQKSFPDAAVEASLDFPTPPPAPDLDYLALPPEFGRRMPDLALSVAAQGVLRLFACKLPGFARSSLNYLYSNFLDCCAAVEERADQRVVFLSRPPLHLVLGISGLNRCNYQLSWLDGKACAVFPEG
ncbi:MAG TPA: hypothetical protein VKL99_15395 [Candidatus Angelobacter sp.]|nr:hypothetical protein [Candidatus Angelobacter sp.]